MKHTANPLLQPLRIPSGWRITFNDFRELNADGLEPSSSYGNILRKIYFSSL